MWADSASGGFASKKHRNESTTDAKPYMKSPEKSKEKGEKIGSVKKGGIKIHSLQQKESTSALAQTLQQERSVVMGRPPAVPQHPADALKDTAAKVMQLKETGGGKRRKSKNSAHNSNGAFS